MAIIKAFPKNMCEKRWPVAKMSSCASMSGAATIRRLVPNAVTIFLIAESEDELVRRLQDRKTEEPDKLKMRIVTAREEMKRIHEFDYVVVNRMDEQKLLLSRCLVLSVLKRIVWTGRQ
ncbi:MAG: hypothetical protein R2867_02220 [Caldilineaceae bacterium]